MLKLLLNTNHFLYLIEKIACFVSFVSFPKTNSNIDHNSYEIHKS